MRIRVSMSCGIYYWGRKMEQYQDYVIKDGQFIGKFEEMYQKFDDPWHQTIQVGQSYSRHATLLSLKLLQAKSVLEVGCGLGYFTDYMTRSLPEISITGLDLSETAVKKAKKRFPDLNFVAGNVCDSLAAPRAYDTIILSEIMWYILDDLDTIIRLLSENFAGKNLIINQSFYKSGQLYGAEYFTTLQQMTAYLPFEMKRAMEVDCAEKSSTEAHAVFEIKI